MTSIRTILKWHKENGYDVYENNANLDQLVSYPKGIYEAKAENITFINERFKKDLESLDMHTGSKLIIIQNSLLNIELIPKGIAIISSKAPKLTLAYYCQNFISNTESEANTIHPDASISATAKIGEGCKIGAFAVIEDNVTIGTNCQIGSGTIVSSNSIIKNNVKIGSCTVIGGTGFGYVKNEDSGEFIRFPHFGKVIIHENVEIGSNTCIDKGSLSDTIIEKGVKIDNLVHIAHNAVLGENSLIIAGAVVAGSVVIGKNCWISPHSTIRDGLKIGDNSTIGLASTVTKDVASEQTVVGSPAVDLKNFLHLRSIEKRILLNQSENE